jgi:ATP-binding cassette, subfamily B, heavy metal transporter
VEEKPDLGLNVRRLFALIRPYWVIFALTLLCVLLFEAASLAEKLLFKYIVDKGTLFSAGTLERHAFITVLITVVVAYGIVLLVKTLSQFSEHVGVNRIETSMITDLKRKFFNHILGLSHNFHTTHKTGSLISRLTRGSRAVERMMDVIFFNVATIAFQISAGLISLAVIYPAAAIVIAVTFAAFIAFSRLTQRWQYPAAVHLNNTDDREKGNIGDFLTNVDSVKYYGKEHVIQHRYKLLSEETRKAMRKAWGYWPWITAGQHLILSLGLFTLVWVSVRGLLGGTVSIGTLVFIYTVYLGLLGPLFRFVNALRDFYQSAADFESLYQYEAITNEIIEQPSAKPLHVQKGSVAYNNVTFRYGSRTIFEEFNLTVKPGEKVALVGSSGAGKSTLIKLLYRLYDPQEGSITVDGVDIRTVQQESLRSELAIVPQECVLFDDTIYNNIAFSKPGATRQEVFAAMKFSQLDKFIADLPQKENTIVGERGVKLSGGEKQRVSIARAILANKKILVLDEATSSLDSETEHDIQQALVKLMKGRTAVIIAHRLSTIMNADRIIVLSKGKIAQSGTHDALIKQPGLYKKLWNLQRGGYIK